MNLERLLKPFARTIYVHKHWLGKLQSFISLKRLVQKTILRTVLEMFRRDLQLLF